MKLKVSVIGIGYIGLPTAAILASKGIDVLGVDTNKSIVDIINKGMVHISEPDLDHLVQAVVLQKKLRARLKPEPSDVFIIAVPTPITGEKEPDLSYVKAAIKSISSILKKGDIIILESTSPVGTTEKMIEWMNALRPDLSFPKFGSNNHKYDISIAYSPERVLPGKILSELKANTRIIGGVTEECSEKVKKFYQYFVETEPILTDCRTAELCKLVENSYRDVNIAFANELSLITDELNIDVWELIKMANYHPRVNILDPGPGVGGHCIAIDPWFIVDSASNQSKLIKVAREVNDFKPHYVVEKLKELIEKERKNIRQLTIACFGLAYKPDIEDLRESAALEVVNQIQSMGFKQIYINEPNIKELPKILNNNDVVFNDIQQALSKSDIFVFLVNHKEFNNISFNQISNRMILDISGVFRQL